VEPPALPLPAGIAPEAAFYLWRAVGVIAPRSFGGALKRSFINTCKVVQVRPFSPLMERADSCQQLAVRSRVTLHTRRNPGIKVEETGGLCEVRGTILGGARERISHKPDGTKPRIASRYGESGRRELRERTDTGLWTSP
jgi:hypothetical protein